MISMEIMEKVLQKTSLLVVAVILISVVIVASLVHALGDLGVVVEKMEGAGEVKQCPICGRFMKVGKIPKEAGAILGNVLREGLSDRDIGYRSGNNNGNYINLLIFRYEERIGGNFGVEKPAGVGFHMHLLENNVLKRVFVFDEDQQSLTENLFNMGTFFRRGAKWLTVEELSRDAINQGLGTILEEHK
jgi:hypothetical protein